ncbi:hypothetical protein PV336_27900 [Streptomyces sp. MI02-2A]|jgi:hypothetical protein|uniref:hypothetical protein n=1 Tax=unclassified Streptomyces TaxID=2593676 RepID=UPI00074113F3|nr:MULTISPECIES: hypothetical protein [unclassified Streptomyces]KUJ34727.1 hypothetical protein ADL25_39830 [Streptomyces sp. NRRL F-5122]MDX3263004.1 hypothetical protein [Streptomyces sp. MI02-2A]REE66213.1 hypothetical protein BX257_9032 [Streptomyces sp. 3212.3]
MSIHGWLVELHHRSQEGSPLRAFYLVPEAGDPQQAVRVAVVRARSETGSHRGMRLVEGWADVERVDRDALGRWNLRHQTRIAVV